MMKKKIFGLAVAMTAALTMNTACSDGDFGGDYVVEGVKLQEVCGTWVCSVESYDPWFTMYYYYSEAGYTPDVVNAELGDPYGVTSPDANDDGIVDEKDFDLYTEQELWWNEFDVTPEFITSNTAANNTTEMLITDSFWGEVYKVNINIDDKTFSAGTVVDEPYEPLMLNPKNIAQTYSNDGKPVVLGGKIMKGAATAPGSGMKTDSILFYVKYADDYGPDMYYKVSGYLKTGYTEDN